MDYKQRKAAFTIGTRLMMDHFVEVRKGSVSDIEYIDHMRSHFLEAITEAFTGIWELENRHNELTPTTNADETAKYYQEFLADCGANRSEQEFCVKKFYSTLQAQKQNTQTRNHDDLVQVMVASLRRMGPTEKPN